MHIHHKSDINERIMSEHIQRYNARFTLVKIITTGI